MRYINPFATHFLNGIIQLSDKEIVRSFFFKPVSYVKQFVN